MQGADQGVIIRNNQPHYVVLSEMRDRELIAARDEAYAARVRGSVQDVKTGRAQRSMHTRLRPSVLA